MTTSIEAWLENVGPGWHPLITDLHEALLRYDPTYDIYCVKEKFGTLRYYCQHDGSDDQYPLVRAAEELSSRTCEQCGAPAALRRRPRGWLKTMCEDCEPDAIPFDWPEYVWPDGLEPADPR